MNEFRAKSIENKNKAAALFRAAPETMKAFAGLMSSVAKDAALSSQQKELIALAIAVVSGCDGCILHHVEEAIRLGAGREMIVETISVAIEMGGVQQQSTARQPWRPLMG